MMFKFFVVSLHFMVMLTPLLKSTSPYDLTIVGPVRFADGIGRQSIELIDTLKDHVKINFIPVTADYNFTDVNDSIKKIIVNEDKTPGNVAIFEASIAFGDAYKKMPQGSINIAYSMVETNRVIDKTVDVINQYFDAVVVPSEFLVGVYKKSGVKKPIFYLPLGVYLDDFFKKEPLSKSKKSSQQPFVFGCTASFVLRKSYFQLVSAFFKEFGNKRDVILRINGRMQKNSYFKKLKRLVDLLGVSNIELTQRDLPWIDYINFMASFDCLVNISLGEGYSIVPREAMALGIPCILSNNSGQTPLCQSGFVCSVPSTIPVAADGPIHAGSFSSCSEDDVRKALRDMYNNYAAWSDKAQESRAWAAQFTWQNLQKKYLNLVKPKKIILGKKNEITDDYLETSCPILYKKYLAIKK